MGKRLKNYIAMLGEQLGKEMTEQERQELYADMLIQIGFFQHERLIHLMITLTFALLTIGAVLGCYISPSIPFFVLTLMLLVLLVPYIRHYFILENGIQKLYRFADDIQGSKVK